MWNEAFSVGLEVFHRDGLTGARVEPDGQSAGKVGELGARRKGNGPFSRREYVFVGTKARQEPRVLEHEAFGVREKQEGTAKR
jgi:hypothetical protein